MTLAVECDVKQQINLNLNPVEGLHSKNVFYFIYHYDLARVPTDGSLISTMYFV